MAPACCAAARRSPLKDTYALADESRVRAARQPAPPRLAERISAGSESDSSGEGEGGGGDFHTPPSSHDGAASPGVRAAATVGEAVAAAGCPPER